MFMVIKNRLWSFTLKILLAVNCSFKLIQSNKHMSLFNEGQCVHMLKSERKGFVFKKYHTFKLCLSKGKTKHLKKTPHF